MKNKTILKNISLSIASIFTTLVFIEIFLVAVDYHYTPLTITDETKNKSDYREYHMFEDKHFIFDPYLTWRPKKNFSVFNSQGYRGKELSTTKNPDEYRIFAIGDSNTLGWSDIDGANWPMYLQYILPEEKFTVINAGVWGYSSFQGLQRFKEALSFQPDMVLISFGANDAHRVVSSDRESLQKITTSAFLLNLRIGHFILKFMDKYFLPQPKESLVPRVSIEEYKHYLNEMITVSKSRDILCVLLTRPFIGESPSELWWKNFAPDYNRVTLEIAKEQGIPAIDVYSYFKDKEEVFGDESHYREIGHRMMANFIYDNINPFLPSHDSKDLKDFISSIWYCGKLKGFHDEGQKPIWTNGDAKIEDIRLNINGEDNFLMLNTFGWHPYQNNMDKIKLHVFANGIQLKFSHHKDSSYYFSLNKSFKEIHEIRIVSSTFIPKELGINDDTRKLGIDIKNIAIK